MNFLIKGNLAATTGKLSFFRSAWLVCACLVSLASLSLAASLSAPPGRLPTQSFELAFKEYRLKNGLRVILSEDHSAPTFSICVTYNVGSRDERPGRTGFAHLFEHILFQGSDNVGKGEHIILVQNNGGRANGTTNPDRTNYYETLPANQLELGIFLEADRMRAPNITQANLNAATLSDAAEFFRTYYAPNNAVLSLVGDFKSEAALKLIKKYFENIPAQAPPPAPDVA